ERGRMMQYPLHARIGFETALSWQAPAQAEAEPLPTLPSHLFHLMKLMNEPGTTSGQLADFVLADPALTARVFPMLTVSPLRGIMPGASLRRDIVLLGRERLHDLTFSTPILDPHRSVQNIVSVEKLWVRSAYCARAAEALARYLDYPEPDKAYLAGLWH